MAGGQRPGASGWSRRGRNSRRARVGCAPGAQGLISTQISSSWVEACPSTRGLPQGQPRQRNRDAKGAHPETRSDAEVRAGFPDWVRRVGYQPTMRLHRAQTDPFEKLSKVKDILGRQRQARRIAHWNYGIRHNERNEAGDHGDTNDRLDAIRIAL